MHNLLLQVKAVRQEIAAVQRLLKRSNINTAPNHLFVRNLSTSVRLFDSQKESGNDASKQSSSDENKPSEEGNNQKNNRRKDKKVDDNDRKNNTNKMIGYLTKTILWICLIYSISFTIIVISSILRGGAGGEPDANNGNHIISWKEFAQYMLAAGEVKEIVVRPQFDYVRVILYPDAIVNGRRPRYNSYMISVPNIERFEQRIREVEKSMGIAEGMLVQRLLNITYNDTNSIIEF